MDTLNFTNQLYEEGNLYPFDITRGIQEIRIGILTIREKWEKLHEKLKQHPGGKSGLTFPVNLIPSNEFPGEIASPENDFTKESNNYRLLVSPRQIFEFNDWAIRSDFKLITHGRVSQKISPSNHAIQPANIFIEEGAIVEYSTINATDGPVYIGKNALIMEGALIRGPFAACEGAVIKMGAKIYGATTIGPHCIAGGEIKNSVFFGYSNKAHDGYLGDSVIGEWCNMGAGTSNSNIKNTAGSIKLWNNTSKLFETDGIKCGLLMGDYSRCAINTSFNTGTVVGICCNIFGNTMPPKYIPDFSWGNEKYILAKALEDIDNWKRLKGLTITESEKNLLTDLQSS